MMDLGTLGNAIVLIVFIGIVVWVFSRKRKARWEEDAQIPFEDDPKPPSNKDSSGRNDQ